MQKRTRIIDRCDNSYGTDDLMTDCVHGLEPCKRNCPKFKPRPKLSTDDERMVYGNGE